MAVPSTTSLAQIAATTVKPPPPDEEHVAPAWRSRQTSRPDRWVNLMAIPAGRYAVSEFTGSPHEIGDAWGSFRAWLPTSGYQPDDRPRCEVYRWRPHVDEKTGTFRCELCLPRRPL